MFSVVNLIYLCAIFCIYPFPFLVGGSSPFLSFVFLNFRNLWRPSIHSFITNQNCICFFREEVSLSLLCFECSFAWTFFHIIELKLCGYSSCGAYCLKSSLCCLKSFGCSLMKLEFLTSSGLELKGTTISWLLIFLDQV